MLNGMLKKTSLKTKLQKVTKGCEMQLDRTSGY